MLKYKYKNIVDAFLDCDFDLLIHGCNCFCSFGGGVAFEIKKRLPDAFNVDLLSEPGDITKLGKYSKYQFNNGGFVINGYIQYHYNKPLNNEIKTENGLNYVLADYAAISKLFDTIAKDFNGKSIGIPKIGAGLAFGEWDVIEQLIKNKLVKKGCDVTVFVIDKKEL